VFTRSVLVVAIVVLPVSGCGSGSEEKGASEPASSAAKAGSFKAADVPFTFQYPRGFKQVDEPKEKEVLASVTPTPDDVNNGLKIRVTAETELPFVSYAAEIRGQFEEQLATKVSQREETRGALDLGILEWRKSDTKSDLGAEKTVRLHSTNYFFHGGGKTWQLECLSSQDHRSNIDQACQQAIGSIQFPKS
jgi:hypothetical protein